MKFTSYNFKYTCQSCACDFYIQKKKKGCYPTGFGQRHGPPTTQGTLLTELHTLYMLFKPYLLKIVRIAFKF